MQPFRYKVGPERPSFNTCRFDSDLRYTHVRFETAAANLARPARIFPVSYWNDMNIVIVESPAKAKTINKYLGSSYEVLASFGHVRDLPAKNGSVDPEANFQMIWEVDPKAAGRLNDIAKALKGADKLILATDPDREGEAISWHVLEIMKQKRALKDQKIERVVFNAITKQSVTDAMNNPRQIDGALVDAYMASRALDYLVGFNLSPVLWRKLPGARSAGRVQSVALRLVCDRELEIEKFVPRAEIDPRFLEAPYYIAPNERVAEEAFSIIRDAMQERNVVGLGRVFIARRERVMMLEPFGKGIMATVLRYSYEVRGADAYFDEIPDLKIALLSNHVCKQCITGNVERKTQEKIS